MFPYASPYPFPSGAGGTENGPSADDYVASMLKPAVDYLTSKGLYVILDYHQIDDTDGASATEATEFWAYMAPKFAGYTNVLYEPFNEPMDTSTSWATFKPRAQQWADTIRAGAPDSIVIVPSMNWDQKPGDASQSPLTGTNLTILPLTLAIGWWLWKRKNRGIIALQLLVVTVGSLSLNPTMKYLLGRDRPDLFPRRGMYNWASYPSGHAILTIAVYITVALLLYRTRGWRWPFLVAVAVFLLNAYSRLYLAVHWPTDLVGGLFIGIVWLLGTWRAFSRHPAHRAALTPL